MQNNAAMKAFVKSLLTNKLPGFYCYHNFGHTLYVADKAVEIGRNEQCSPEELELLNTAALWHDTGCIIRYKGHEELGCGFVRQYLPGYGYDDAQIKIICGMIMATKLPQSPKNRLEEILADADLEYLGTADVEQRADLLFRELHEQDPSLTREKWNLQQIAFIKDHQYFTAYCRKVKEPLKAAYLKSLLSPAT
jgi:uncharacterized protein